MASVLIKDLVPMMQPLVKSFLAKAKDRGFDLRITSGYRSLEEQAELYAQGRTKPGSIVTNAKPGQSNHNHRRAIDVVDRKNGYNIDWPTIGSLGESCGLSWGGRWRRFVDKPHFEYLGPAEATSPQQPIKEEEMANLDTTLDPNTTTDLYRAIAGRDPENEAAKVNRPVRMVIDLAKEAVNVALDSVQKNVARLTDEVNKAKSEADQLRGDLNRAINEVGAANRAVELEKTRNKELLKLGNTVVEKNDEELAKVRAQLEETEIRLKQVENPSLIEAIGLLLQAIKRGKK